jgi:hypothetical protein
MSRGLYSDPFLKALLEKEPKLAKEFLEAISNTEYVGEPEIVSCLEVPGWVLEKAGIDACINPNFPEKKFQEFLNNEELVFRHFWKILDYPQLSKEQVSKLMQSADANVRGLALVHPLGNSSELIKYLKQVISDKSKSSYVIIYICQHVNLSDEIFTYLYRVHDFEGVSKTIGQALWDNPTLSEEQKAALVLADIKPKDDSASAYWGDRYLHFISSIPYFQSLKTNVGYYKSKKLNSIPPFEEALQAFFTREGHHLSVVLTEASEKSINVTLDGLQELVSLELLHRLFWTELCQRDDFNIYRRNAYRVDDVSISHPILGRDFEEIEMESESDESSRLGGVIMFSEQNWLVGEQDLDVDRASAVLNSYADSMVTIMENENYENIGQSLIALTYEVPDTCKKFGFELTESGYDWMVEAAIELAEPDDFDVSAGLNPDFHEILSWAKLPDVKKETIFEFLKLGYQEKHSKLQSDSLHFLGCMALHEATPKNLLKKLAELGDPLIDEVLASR